MTDDSDGISLEKAGPATADATIVSADDPAGALTPPTDRPKQAGWVVAALAVCGLAALGASLSLYGLHHFLVVQLFKANAKLSKPKSRADVLHTASQQPAISLTESAIFFAVLLFVAIAVWRGRYWARWAVIGLWVLTVLTGVYGSPLQLTALLANAPLALKVPIFLSSASFVVAVGLMGFAKPLAAWLALSRPQRAAGSAPARRGMFAPRDPVRSARQGLSTASPVGSRKVREAAARNEDLFRGDANTERARAKQRATTETMQRGADEARARARDTRGRGSKSRRGGS